VVGFGSVAVTGVYAAGARRPDRPGARDETARYFRGRGWTEFLILGVPVFGVAAVADRWGSTGFTQVWVVAGLIAWAGAAVILMGAVRPMERSIRTKPTAGDAGRLMWASLASDVLFVTALVFMIAQPP
jgi:hypothetical protein